MSHSLSHQHEAGPNHSSAEDPSGGGHHNDMYHSMHAMSFHFGMSELILFDFWDVNSGIGLIFSCVIIIAMCFAMEFLRWYRLYRTRLLLLQQPILQAQQASSQQQQTLQSRSPSNLSGTTQSTGSNQMGSPPLIRPQLTPFRRRIDGTLLVDGLLHGAQLTLGYLLMLVFMTFNVWLCLTVVVGEVIARLVFSLTSPPQLQLLNELAVVSTETCCG